MKTKAFRKIFGTFAVLALALGVGVAIRSVSAGSGDNVFGFAWGGNEVADTNGAAVPNNGAIDGDESGLGWVSFNSTDCDTNGNGTIEASEVTARPACPAGPTANYGVNIPVGVNGDLSGYAWSEHYGWISFNAADLVGCPSGACKAERVGYQIKGWARILSVRDAGANAGGWSGWIQLDPASAGMSATALNVMAFPARFEGYSYSDELGWLQFNPAQGGVFHGVVAVNTLKLCYDSCTTGPLVPATAGFAYNESKDVVACYNTASGCDAPDNSGNVTSNPLTSWNESGANVVASSVVNVGGVGDTKRWTSGSTSGTEIINVIYNGGSPISFDAEVSCSPSPNCNAARAGVCIGQTVSAGVTETNACGTISCAGEQGTRYCDMNWKEVAPGQ